MISNCILVLLPLSPYPSKPIIKALRSRAEHIEVDISTSQQSLQQAEEKYKSITAELDNMSNRIAGLEKQAAEDATDLKTEIHKRAERDVLRVRESAEHAIRDELERARKALQQETVEAAVALALDSLKTGMVDSDHTRLSRDFVSHLNQEKHHG